MKYPYTYRLNKDCYAVMYSIDSKTVVRMRHDPEFETEERHHGKFHTIGIYLIKREEIKKVVKQRYEDIMRMKERIRRVRAEDAFEAL